ncbi:STAG-like protein [Cordyceps fumosorosea ARSEF 2679]|uniref:STAG-like protein n=1 Tax=Cordyceps fumosorosea (strain ARSEF 2679) TaxID=1081104 RepID=A0A167YBL6_CORFA|nr:STAG-like protein [Cordyceps fumosorosea ARSEF 2679]OAA66123.1 STAG-like protein [Cordyceps fumosorosea ARSEF 2679]
MDNDTAASSQDGDAPRRSGRVVKVPEKWEPEPSAHASTKRKRGGEGDDADDGLESDDDESAEDDDDAGDGDHPAPRARRAGGASRQKKPSLKKPKTNGAGGHTARIPSRPKKTVRIEAGSKGTGLFVDIFGSGEPSQTVAHQWLERYKVDNAAALSDLVNCILQCAGCDLEVTPDDIRDPENIPNRLVDLQGVYQEQNIIEYPLISRAKGTRSFRDLLVTFFHALVALLHDTDIMYQDTELMENLHAWLASMSSSSLRPFRHTATTIALAAQTGLVDVAGTLDRRIANIEQQLQAAKRGKNKSKTLEVQRNLEEANNHRSLCSEAIQSYFDTVFVHRYRDVDPKIRTECVEALGSWIWDLPTVFMEPGYLRYLGWMLSDVNAPTRLEVLRQLGKVFKRSAQQLIHFIDRFRPRLIEIATLDSEISVRVTAISVIDTLRAAALLEPSEIDAIGRLVFDNEIRIRKAVVNFFGACIEDVKEGKVEELGGQEALDEVDGGDEDDFESPRKEWLDIKCLAETLAIYNAQVDEAQQNNAFIGTEVSLDLLESVAPETRITLAAQALYDKIPEIKSWEILAGYLLFDHSTSTKSRSKAKGKSASPEAAFKKAIAPLREEESILLEVLSSGIKSSLTHPHSGSDGDRSRRRGNLAAADALDDIAMELASIIPKLLNKFGAEPETAAIVLRLEHNLDLDVFQQLRQESGKYERLLDEVSTQFIRHDDKRVLSEAAAALLHARQYDELEELTDSKLSLLWDNVIDALRNVSGTCELSVRGNLASGPLHQLSTLLMKISKLASIADCVDILEAEPRSQNAESSAIQILINVVHRGKYEPQEDEIDDLEDEVVTLAIKACQFYFMWKIRALSKRLATGTSVPDSELDRLSILRQSYRRHIIETFSSRAAIDQLRLFSTGSLCDLHLSFATLRPRITALRNSADRADADKYKTLIQEIEPGLIPEMTSIFDGAEKQFAKRSKKEKGLNEPAEDEDPMSDEEEDDADDEEDAELTPEQRYANELRAEKSLCELTAKYVLAISGRLIDDRGGLVDKLRRRILRNQTKLGHNFKEVVAFLDEEKMARAARKAAPKHAAAAAKPVETPTTAQDLDDMFEAEPEPEEGSREDLRRKGLLGDDPLDDDDDDENQGQENSRFDDDVLGD